MKSPLIWSRSIFGLALILAVVLPMQVTQAAHAALTCNQSIAVIQNPQPGAALSGVVQVEGTASLGGGFQYYKVEFSAANRDDWVVFSGLVRQQVVNGQLAVWDSASVPDGVYSMRLRVVDVTGNYCEWIITQLRVQNSAPVQPTPAPTLVPSTPTVTPTPAPPSPTPTPQETESTQPFNAVPSAVPTIQAGPTDRPGTVTATPLRPSGTRTPGSTSFLSGFNTSAIFDAVRDIFSGAVRTFLFGAMAAAGIMLVVGVIYYVRRVL